MERRERHGIQLTLFLYYGAADTRIGLATANRSDVLSYLQECPSA
jgi:predicted GH43/DUF377 family glycosyl hydrolase